MANAKSSIVYKPNTSETEHHTNINFVSHLSERLMYLFKLNLKFTTYSEYV